MANPSDLILSKYYGFGADFENKKFLSSHDGTYEPKNCQRQSSFSDPSGTETTEDVFGQCTSSEAANDKMENSTPGKSPENIIVRSSRAIQNDETFDEVLSDVNDYEHFLESADCPNDASPRKEKTTSNGRNFLTTGKSERADDRDRVICNDSSFIGQLDETLSDNVSDISSNPMKKRPKKRNILTTTSTKAFLQPAASLRSKVLPACNGVFFDLTNLSLVEFPVNMLSNIPNLRMLYLENNSLTKLPEELFSSLKLLQWLDVRNNKISTLPTNIKYHISLETLLLEGNLIEKLPLELCLIPSLKTLQTSRNPLIFPPADILALGFTAAMNYLRCEWNKLHPESPVESPNRERKLEKTTILCSDSQFFRANPKTSRLFDRSSTEDFKGRYPTVTTEGARIISVKKKKKKKNKNYRPSNRLAISSNEIHNQLLQKNSKPAVLCDECSKNDASVLGSHDEIPRIVDKNIKPSKIKLPMIDRKHIAFGSNSRIHGSERVFNIITNDKTMEKLFPMRLKDPDGMLAFLGNYLEGINSEPDVRLLAKVEKMLAEQALTLQRIKDKDAMRDWRQNRKSYEKSMSRAAARTEEDIPFGTDIRSLGVASGSKSTAPPKNIDDKLKELHESLSRLQESRILVTLSPRMGQKLLQNEIKQISEVQKEIKNLRRYNVLNDENRRAEPVQESELPSESYKPPPSIII